METNRFSRRVVIVELRLIVPVLFTLLEFLKLSKIVRVPPLETGHEMSNQSN